jgi:hypothetical protein
VKEASTNEFKQSRTEYNPLSLASSALAFLGYIGSDDMAGTRFVKAMIASQNISRYAVDDILSRYGWEGLGSATVVDVGGSYGHVAFRLQDRFPNLRFIVRDLPEIVSQAEQSRISHLRSEPELAFSSMISSRPSALTVRYLHFILHNWSDQYGARVLSNILPGMKKGDRILANDRIVDEFASRGLMAGCMGVSSHSNSMHAGQGLIEVLVLWHMTDIHISSRSMGVNGLRRSSRSWLRRLIPG